MREFRIDDGLLGQYAANESRRAVSAGKIGVSAVRRAALNNIALISAAAAKGAVLAAKQKIPTELEWLLDNRYLIEREGRDAALALRHCPRLPRSKPRKEPLAYAAAKSLTRAAACEVTPMRLESFLLGYQTAKELCERELAAFIPLLKCALIAALAKLTTEMKPVIGGQTVPRERSAEWEQKVGGAITSLRGLTDLDAGELLQKCSVAEQLLRSDPAGLYAEMSEQTKAEYRSRLSEIARAAGLSEREAARKAIAFSNDAKSPDRRHVGWYIFKKPLGHKPKTTAGRLWFIGIFALTVLFGAAAFVASRSVTAAILAAVILYETAKTAADLIAVKAVKPTHIPRMECESGLPPEGNTLCVITSVAANPTDTADLAKKIEAYYLTNRDAGAETAFGLLLDKRDDSPEGFELFGAVKAQIEAFSLKYNHKFYLFSREQIFVKSEGKRIGWERKRGAIGELMRLLRGKPTGLQVLAGDADALQSTQFVLTLDADTRLAAGTLRRVASAMIHPLNRAVIDAEKLVVSSGYGILQPRVGVDLAAARATFFTRIYAGLGGVDPYGGNVSDVYQDLFGRAPFVGKGIIGVDAYLACLDDRLPEERVLSHDLLESAYLRAGFVGDIEWTDGYPSKISGWLTREHRWTRGDWQIASWLRKKVPNGEKNPINPFSKWQIFENLRRSVTPMIALICLIFGGATLKAAVLLAFASRLLISAGRLAFRGSGYRASRYHSTVIFGVKAATYQLIGQLFLLPQQAFLGIHAAATALWRVNISHKKLLNWRTFADSEHKRATNFVWFTVISAIGCLFLREYALSLIWFLSPIYQFFASKPTKQPKSLSESDKNFLLGEAKNIWQYFADFLTDEDNHLPPDNYQEHPKPLGGNGIAHRTSPTNIGLALLSVISAHDLKLIDGESALRYVNKILTSVERLQTWHGHMYNWYDTQNLSPLRPRCVSTVDSGNFAGCLIALREALFEFDDCAAEDLAQRAQILYENIDFRPLYNKKRNLFHIGYDVEIERLTDGYYDLLASEARQTSYITIAKNQIPRRHWARLNRALVARDGYAGMASWTGTMFEYVMPQLLMSTPKESLLDESLKFALYCQKSSGRAQKTVWGTSESCFYAFDASLNYQYKAHGDPNLAFKRGLGKELVIAPYATYLALQIDPYQSIGNLKTMHKMQASGRYGLCEAIDFTPARLTGKFMTVRSFMSHHLGMSLLAINNVLCDNILQKRFAKDTEMSAFQELVEEKIPIGGVVMRTKDRELPEKPVRGLFAGWSKTYSNLSSDRRPNFGIFTNGSYTLLAADNGLTRSTDGEISLTRFSTNTNKSGLGWQFGIRESSSYVNLTKNQNFADKGSYSARIELDSMNWEYKSAEIEAKIRARVPYDEHGENRTVSIKNCTNTVKTLEIISYSEPVLAKSADYESHPAFSKLFMQTKICENGAIISRRPREGKSFLYLANLCSENSYVNTSRETALGRGGAEMLPYLSADRVSASEGSVLDPCLLIVTKITLNPGETKKIRYSMSLSSTENDAYASALRILDLGDDADCAGFGFAMRKLKMTADEVNSAFETASDLLCPKRMPGAQRNTLGQQNLWKWGVSGDYPILLVDDTKNEILTQQLKQHYFLTLCGLSFDIVILTRDGGDYRRPQRAHVHEILKFFSRTHTLASPCGVHLIDVMSTSVEERELLSAIASFQVGEYAEIGENYVNYLLNIKKRENFHVQNPVKYEYTTDNTFCFSGMPEIAWGHVLCNNSFGALVTDSGLGHVWRQNARENKITPWVNDPLVIQGAETLYLSLDRYGIISPFNDFDGYNCKIEYSFGYAMYHKNLYNFSIKTTVFVPNYRMARIILIECSEEYETLWSVPLVMGSDEQFSRQIVTETEGDFEVSRNGYNTPYNPQYVIKSNKKYGNISVLLLGCAENRPGIELIKNLTDLEMVKEKLSQTVNYWQNLVRPKLFDSGMEEFDHYLNGWALYQVIGSRLFARASLYQCGGAYGFRDQLQDVCAVMQTDLRLAKQHILRACAHQFEEGDVQHWWHPANRAPEMGDNGVRTRCSDDLVWLPYAVCEYVNLSGDRDILQIEVPYLSAAELEADQHDRFDLPRVSEKRETVCNHCVRAIERVLSRGTGTHDLLFFGDCDWNDGFNNVGEKGESVWLTWFTAIVMSKFSAICDNTLSKKYKEMAVTLAKNAEKSWDGKWFKRGWYDDGTPLGSAERDECKIDSIAQSFAAICASELPNTLSIDRVRIALDSAVKNLVNFDERIVKLFDPPFEKSLQEPGYIKGYVAGVRENGGQYTHAAIWLAQGIIADGRRDFGRSLLNILLPETHDLAKYKAEPHVLAADIYAVAPHEGRGGWSHYTGAAAWFYRVSQLTIDKWRSNDVKYISEHSKSEVDNYGSATGRN